MRNITFQALQNTRPSYVQAEIAAVEVSTECPPKAWWWDEGYIVSYDAISHQSDSSWFDDIPAFAGSRLHTTVARIMIIQLTVNYLLRLTKQEGAVKKQSEEEKLKAVELIQVLYVTTRLLHKSLIPQISDPRKLPEYARSDIVSWD